MIITTKEKAISFPVEDTKPQEVNHAPTVRITIERGSLAEHLANKIKGFYKKEGIKTRKDQQKWSVQPGNHDKLRTYLDAAADKYNLAQANRAARGKLERETKLVGGQKGDITYTTNQGAEAFWASMYNQTR